MYLGTVAADPASAPAAGDPPPVARHGHRAATLGGGDDPFPSTMAVAHGPFAAVGRTARWNAMADHCGGVTWRCIGEVAGQPWSSIGGDDAWGVVKPSHADAARSASGLLSFAVIVSDYWGSTDFTGTDLENDDARSCPGSTASRPPSPRTAMRPARSTSCWRNRGSTSCRQQRPR